MFNLFGKNKKTEKADTQDENTIVEDDSQWDKNLSWSDDLIPEEIYVKGYKDTPLDTEKIMIASTSAAVGSNKAYKTLPKDDTNLIILVRKLENFLTDDEIAKKREFYKEQIQKMEQAKQALQTLTANSHESNPSLTMAYTTIDSDLRHLVVEQRSFEAKLRMETQSIEDFMEVFKETADYPKVVLLVSMYGFNNTDDGILEHRSQAKPKLETVESGESDKIKVSEKDLEVLKDEPEDQIQISSVAMA
jgi:hypothetical protein